MTLALVALFVAQQQGGSAAAIWVTSIVSAVGAVTGAAAMWRGITAERRQQRISDEKANRDELEATKDELRRVEKELDEMRQREWEARQDKQRTQYRLERVEQELVAANRRIKELEANRS